MYVQVLVSVRRPAQERDYLEQPLPLHLEQHLVLGELEQGLARLDLGLGDLVEQEPQGLGLD